MPRSLTDQLSTVLSGVERQLAAEMDPRKRQALQAQRQTLLQAGAVPAIASTTTAVTTPSVTSGVLRQVQAAKPKALTVPTITERPGQTVDLSRWFQGIGQGPGQTFTFEQLQRALARPLPEPGQPRFATPEQLGQWIGQFQQVQEPWLQAATQLAQAETNKALQGLQSQWAARGLLASGGAAAKEREAAENLGLGLGELRTRALADAVGQALQAGQLSLEEAAQLWQRAFQGRQADVENLLASLGLQEQTRANWLDQLARAYQTDIGQQQWAQELGLQRAREDLQRWLGTQQLNQQVQSDWLSRLLQAGGLAEEARQFERQMPLREAELTGLLYGQPTLPAREFDWQRALQEAGLTGTWQGQPTWDRLLQEAQLTGTYQGQPTFERWLAGQQLAQSQAKAQEPSAADVKARALSSFGKTLSGLKKEGTTYEQAYEWLLTEAAPVLAEYGLTPFDAIRLLNEVYGKGTSAEDFLRSLPGGG